MNDDIKNINPLIGEVNPDFDGTKEEEELPEKAWYVINRTTILVMSLSR